MVLASPNAAQKQAEIQNLHGMLEKAVQQLESDSDMETFKVDSQDDDDDDVGEMQDLDSLLAEVQDSDEETMAEKQAPNKDTADARVNRLTTVGFNRRLRFRRGKYRISASTGGRYRRYGRYRRFGRYRPSGSYVIVRSG